MAAEPRALLARALGSDVEPPDDALSERILDATLHLVAASGVRKLTIDEVARQAGVGRMTVYRRFGDKSTLVDALAVREARRCLAELDAAASPEEPIADQFAAGFVTSLRIARRHPVLSRLVRFEPHAALAALLASDGAVFALARAFTAGRLRAAHRAGVLGELDAEVAAELLVRMMLSFVLIEQTVLPLDDEDALREIALTMLGPLAG
jgi:AcrR family transcriptional regulator